MKFKSKLWSDNMSKNIQLLKGILQTKPALCLEQLTALKIIKLPNFSSNRSTVARGIKWKCQYTQHLFKKYQHSKIRG